ncbi:hypothetical protein Hanom_Chr00s000005g01612381 [Helianthus anomalus]
MLSYLLLLQLKMGWWMATCCDDCNGGWQRCCEQPRSRSVDYKKIIGMSKFPLTNTSNLKDLYSLLSSGIFIHHEKVVIQSPKPRMFSAFHTFTFFSSSTSTLSDRCYHP